MLSVRGVDLWIGVEDLGGVRKVSVHGRLAGAMVAELDRVVQGLEPPLQIDLSQLLSVDEEGLEALRALRRDGGRLVAIRPIIELQIDAEDGSGEWRATASDKKPS